MSDTCILLKASSRDVEAPQLQIISVTKRVVLESMVEYAEISSLILEHFSWVALF